MRRKLPTFFILLCFILVVGCGRKKDKSDDDIVLTDAETTACNIGSLTFLIPNTYSYSMVNDKEIQIIDRDEREFNIIVESDEYDRYMSSKDISEDKNGNIYHVTVESGKIVFAYSEEEVIVFPTNTNPTWYKSITFYKRT